LVNNAEKSYGNLNHWIGRKVTDFLTTESIPKLEFKWILFHTV
jgi:hypothetical protein